MCDGRVTPDALQARATRMRQLCALRRRLRLVLSFFVLRAPPPAAVATCALASPAAEVA